LQNCLNKSYVFGQFKTHFSITFDWFYRCRKSKTHKVVYVSSRRAEKLIKNLVDFCPLCISEVDGNLHFWTWLLRWTNFSLATFGWKSFGPNLLHLHAKHRRLLMRNFSTTIYAVKTLCFPPFFPAPLEPRPLIHLASSPSQSAQLFMLELQSVEPKPMKFPGNTWDNAQSAAYTPWKTLDWFLIFNIRTKHHLKNIYVKYPFKI